MNKKQEQILEILSAALQESSQVFAAFAYGSILTDYFNADSDIDLAILADKAMTSVEVFNLQNDLSALVSKDVSIVKIEPGISLLLQNEIARKGKLLFTKDENLSDLFVIKAPQIYEDFMHTHQGLVDDYLEKASIVNKEIIVQKFNAVDVCLERIKTVISDDLSNFENLDKQDVFIINLQRACQAVIDVAAHIIKSKQLPLTPFTRGYFETLEKEKVLSKDLSEKLKKMVGFRNIAVHDYEKLDSEILKSIYKNNLQDLVEFKKVIVKLIR